MQHSERLPRLEKWRVSADPNDSQANPFEEANWWWALPIEHRGQLDSALISGQNMGMRESHRRWWSPPDLTVAFQSFWLRLASFWLQTLEFINLTLRFSYYEVHTMNRIVWGQIENLQMNFKIQVLLIYFSLAWCSHRKLENYLAMANITARTLLFNRSPVPVSNHRWFGRSTELD